MIFQNLTAAIDASGMCLFTSFALGADDYAAFLKAATGFDYDGAAALQAGEPHLEHRRMFNLREGLDLRRKTPFPTRLLKEPIPDGPSKGMLAAFPKCCPVTIKPADGMKGRSHDAKLQELGLK